MEGKKRVGNRTNSRRDIAEAVAVSNAAAELEAKRKEAIIQMMNNRRKVRASDSLEWIQKIEDYIQEQEDKDEPLTVSGFILAVGVCRDTWDRANRGELDYLLIKPEDIIESEHLDGVTLADTFIPFSEITQKCYLMLENQAEQRLYKSGRVGDIFTLRARYGWQDDTPKTVNNNLIIASEEQARKALDLLK